MMSSEMDQRQNPEHYREIQREIAELRRRDQEKYHQEQVESKQRIQEHVDSHGGDLSLLLSHPVPSQVKCVQLDSFGTSKNVHTVKCPLPLPSKNEILIRTYSCGVNVNDLMMRQGLLDNWVRRLKAPFIMGSELAGEIVGLGRDVQDFQLGDRVVAFPERRGWSQYATCRFDCCFKIPQEMSYHDAIAITLNGIVAYSLVFELGNLRPNKTVLLHSAPGGLGNMISQMVKTVPNVRLFKVVSREDIEHAALPSSNIVYINQDADYVSEIRHISPHGVDLVLDCEYEDNFSRDFNLIRPMGRYILFGTHSAVLGEKGFLDSARSWWGQEKVSPLRLFEENKAICGFNLRHLLYFQRDRGYVCDVVGRVFEMWQAGKIQPVIDCALQFDDFGEAMQRLQEHGQTGKVILDPTMTHEDDKHDRDYFAIAEKNVAERSKPGSKSFRMPAPGDLVRDAGPDSGLIKAEELARAKSVDQGGAPRFRQPMTQVQLQQLTPEQRNRWEQEQQTFQAQLDQMTPEQRQQWDREQQLFQDKFDKMTPEQRQQFLQEQQLFQARLDQMTPEERQQWEQEQKLQRELSVEPINLSGGAFVTTKTTLTPAQQGQEMDTTTKMPTLIHEQPLSPYSVEKGNVSETVLSENLLERPPVYKKEQVEIVVPLTQKEMQLVAEEMPTQLGGTEASQTEQSGFIEKLREAFSPHQRNE